MASMSRSYGLLISILHTLIFFTLRIIGGGCTPRVSILKRVVIATAGYGVLAIFGLAYSVLRRTASNPWRELVSRKHSLSNPELLCYSALRSSQSIEFRPPKLYRRGSARLAMRIT